jgi:hypothetical protein
MDASASRDVLPRLYPLSASANRAALRDAPRPVRVVDDAGNRIVA